MMQMNFSPYMVSEVERRQQELQSAMEKIRIASEIDHSQRKQAAGASKILASIGRQLSTIGASLEQRYSQTSIEPSAFAQQGSLEECS